MSPNKKIYISLAVFGAIVAGFVFLCFLPTVNRIKQDNQEAVFQREVLRALKTKEAALIQLREDYQELKPRLEKIDNLFLDPDYPPAVLNYLEETAGDSGVEITTSALSHSEEKQPWPFFSVKISLVSDFLSLMRFVDRLENAPKLLEIEDPYFRKSGDQVHASFLVKFFTQN